MEIRPKIHPLKQAREQLGLGKDALARRIGLIGKDVISTITLWETGEAIPGYEAAKRLSIALIFGSAEEVLQLCQEWRDGKEDKGKDAPTQDRT